MTMQQQGCTRAIQPLKVGEIFVRERLMHSIVSVRRSCPCCGFESHTTIAKYTRSAWPVVACSGCGFVFLGSVPGYGALITEYAWEKTYAAEKQKRRKSRWGALDTATRFRTKLGKQQDADRIARISKGASRVLEIGCGDSDRIPDSAIPYGIEISEELAKRSHEKFAQRGGRVIHAPALQGLDHFPDNFFDAILMRSYLEHEEHPGPVLAKARRVLHPIRGKIYVRVPNYGSVNRVFMGAKWCGFRFPDHVNYFTLGSLRRLAANHGFACRRINRLSVFDDNLIAVLEPISAARA